MQLKADITSDEVMLSLTQRNPMAHVGNVQVSLNPVSV